MGLPAVPQHGLAVGTYRFPFGQPLLYVMQTEPHAGNPRVFVLGKYASAVHARLGDCPALAVASEPCIFWDGTDPSGSLPTVQHPIPGLVASGASNNGPSGKALEREYLRPLGLSRKDVWLCDVVPYSLQNKGQHRAIARVYEPLRKAHPNLAQAEMPKEADWDLYAKERMEQIGDELIRSKCRFVITLGEDVMKFFLGKNDPLHFPYKTLSRQCAKSPYGQWCDFSFRGKRLLALPLAHMRTTSLAGLKITKWAARHSQWKSSQPTLPIH